MTDFDALLSLAPYGLSKEEKRDFLSRELGALTQHHREHCPEYGAMLRAWGANEGKPGGLGSLPFDCAQRSQIKDPGAKPLVGCRGETPASPLESLPFLPVRLFKEFSLRSVPEEALHKTMTSSGTTGQQVSRIFLDRETSTAQSKALAKITGDFLGGSRLPMIILDSSALTKDRAMFSARGAGILGFSLFGRDKIYALDEAMALDVEGLAAFLEKHQGERIFLFGFTFMIWQHFISELKRLDFHPDLSQGVLIHGGGWKKLSHLAVTAQQFKHELKEICGLTRVHDYYGMVEQTGTIYMECEHGRLHAPVWADVLIRRPGDFSLAETGERGLIQVLSLLPRSYPGHSLLTEDEGAILGEDDCPCGRKGKTLAVYGRVRKAELRGCSDTYEQK